ncbi:hypothetical protein H5410_004868 [Solanum commersonii]|uniref:Uncharacterized protein n=1 Tax=Solanum commersonii TaxID=4109 RepID=A0A9J6A5J9_SOLCO|nr:hypothetical protein H5410_004868 [Solanum commersonii]
MGRKIWMTKDVNTPHGVSLWRMKIIRALYPELKNNTSVRKNIAELSPDQGWDLLTLRKLLNEWKIQKMTKFYKALELFSGLLEGSDKSWWLGHNRGSFKTKSHTKFLVLFGCWPESLFRIWRKERSLYAPDAIYVVRKQGYHLFLHCKNIT